MKATFQIPDALYREVKVQTAREGRTMREVAISLFEQWLRERKSAPLVPTVDWHGFQSPLAHLVREETTDHSVDAIRESITRHWDEQS